MANLRIRLGDEDREQLGAPEWIEFDTDTVDIDECVTIQDVTGLDFVEFLEGFPRQPLALKAGVWVGLRRGGVEVELKSLSFKPYQCTWRRGDGEELEGKDPSTQPENSDDS
jgi:hypothetical protein